MLGPLEALSGSLEAVFGPLEAVLGSLVAVLGPLVAILGGHGPCKSCHVLSRGCLWPLEAVLGHQEDVWVLYRDCPGPSRSNPGP